MQPEKHPAARFWMKIIYPPWCCWLAECTGTRIIKNRKILFSGFTHLVVDREKRMNLWIWFFSVTPTSSWVPCTVLWANGMIEVNGSWYSASRRGRFFFKGVPEINGHSFSILLRNCKLTPCSLNSYLKTKFWLASWAFSTCRLQQIVDEASSSYFWRNKKSKMRHWVPKRGMA